MSDLSAVSRTTDAQLEYGELVSSFAIKLNGNLPTRDAIGYFLDDLKRFWLPKRAIIRRELEGITASRRSLVLLGAIYLGVEDHEEYYFGVFGERHFIPDPFLKMELLLRAPAAKTNVEGTISYFSRALNDTVKVLERTQGVFTFIPWFDMNVDDSEGYHKGAKDFFELFVKSMIAEDVESLAKFYETNTTLELIESKLAPAAKSYLVFAEGQHPRLSLRKKITEYVASQNGLSELTRGMTEPKLFETALYSWVSQAYDILTQSLQVGFVPYVRFPVTFSYLHLIMNNLRSNPEMDLILDQLFVGFFFRRVIPSSRFAGTPIFEFVRRSQADGFHRLAEKLRSELGPLSQCNLADLKTKIVEEFDLFMRH